jgi:hypothetical protein
MTPADRRLLPLDVCGGGQFWNVEAIRMGYPPDSLRLRGDLTGLPTGHGGPGDATVALAIREGGALDLPNEPALGAALVDPGRPDRRRKWEPTAGEVRVAVGIAPQHALDSRRRDAPRVVRLATTI